MTKWLLIAGAAVVVYFLFIRSSSGTLASSAPAATKATNGNSGFGLTVGSGGISIKF